MNRAASTLMALAVVASTTVDVSAASKTRTPVTSSVKNLKMSPEELRIRVRALIRPALGTVEEDADRIIAAATDPQGRRNALMAKIEMTSTLLAALLRTDPLLALADAWGYVIQVEALESRPSIQASFGSTLPIATGAVIAIANQFRDFVESLQDELSAEAFEATVVMNSSSQKPTSTSSFFIWSAMITIYVIWGSTYLGIRFAVQTIPPFLMAGARFLLAGSVLLPRQEGCGRPKTFSEGVAVCCGDRNLITGRRQWKCCLGRAVGSIRSCSTTGSNSPALDDPPRYTPSRRPKTSSMGNSWSRTGFYRYRHSHRSFSVGEC